MSFVQKCNYFESTKISIKFTCYSYTLEFLGHKCMYVNQNSFTLCCFSMKTALD